MCLGQGPVRSELSGSLSYTTPLPKFPTPKMQPSLPALFPVNGRDPWHALTSSGLSTLEMLTM